MTPEKPLIDAARRRDPVTAHTEQPEALQAIRALREYIEAIPKEIADGLPAMPGIDGEWLDAIEQTLEASQARVPLSEEAEQG